MRISIVQTVLQWENRESNRAMFGKKLAALKGTTELIVLPEMFSTGFTMDAESLAETMDGPTMRWLRNTAQELNAAITGSFICQEAGKYFNRLIFMRPDGNFDFYDKRHLFSLSKENEYFEAGKNRLVLEWQGFRICPLICYDLRFPVWSRNANGNSTDGTPAFDVLIYVANWPNKRAHHWRSLLPARAIENQSFVIGVNIAGSDGNGFEYLGDSAVVDCSGNLLAQIPDGKSEIITVELSLEDLKNFRRQLPFLADADAFELKD